MQRIAYDGPGLSPRVRGNPTAAATETSIWGSIPACAGEPSQVYPARFATAVYPRVCGGTRRRFRNGKAVKGLSPRVRGNRYSEVIRMARKGSIPACAGEPPRRPGATPAGRVYPRVCGGTREATRQPQAARGLSPRVRGNPAWWGRTACASGSIPACAGEPVRPGRAYLGVQVYPRVCGGTRSDLEHGGNDSGLSPRVRGNPQSRAPAHRPAGSIPACAGEPIGYILKRLRH